MLNIIDKYIQVSTTTVLPTIATTGQAVDPTSTDILPSPSITFGSRDTTTVLSSPVVSTGTDRSVYTIPTPTPDESSTTIPYSPFSNNTSVNAPAGKPNIISIILIN